MYSISIHCIYCYQYIYTPLESHVYDIFIKSLGICTCTCTSCMYIMYMCMCIINKHMYMYGIQIQCVLDDISPYIFLQSLTYAIDPSVEKDFLALALSCKSVICCRY